MPGDRAETATLSAIIITHNEAHRLGDCIASLDFCDEIIVVDHDSDDATVAIAREAGARVEVTRDWPGFGLQKQRALELARCEWVLSIDADERVPPALAAEIRAAIASDGADGYRVKRLNHFLGRTLRHGGWYPDLVTRLVRRGAARFSASPVHERLIVDGQTGDLRTPLTHLSYMTIDDVLAKLRRYAIASAEERRKIGRKGGLASALVRAALTFFKCYIIQLGFLDRSHGFVAACFRAQETFWRYLSVGWERDS